MAIVKKLLPVDHPVRIASKNLPETVHQLHQKLCFPTAEGLHILGWREIISCDAEDNYCRIHLENGKQIFLAKTLRTVERFLPDQEFVRIHRSHLVRIEAIVRVHHGEIELQDGSRLPVSRDRYRDIITRLQKITVMVI